MVEGETSPPSLLQEADLIALMEKHGIGESVSLKETHVQFTHHYALRKGRERSERREGVRSILVFQCSGIFDAHPKFILL